MNRDVIKVEQLPIIHQQLQVIKEGVTERVNKAMSLVCTEDTVQEVKKIRAELNRELKAWEEKRKEVKSAVMKPYEEFEGVFKECINDIYKKGDIDLKGKVESVERELKAERQAEVHAYFMEYMESKNMGLAEFITYDRADINITLSASKKSLKDKARAFIDRVCDDLTLIETQEHKDEILYEYKQTLNVSAAITTVVNRYKAIEEAKKREEERKAKEQAAQEAAEKVATIVDTLAPPTVVEPITPVCVKKFVIEITASDEKRRKLIEFLENEDFYYECL